MMNRTNLKHVSLAKNGYCKNYKAVLEHFKGKKSLGIVNDEVI